jgi:site-specific DNA recombinase
MAAKREKLKAYAALYDLELIEIIEHGGQSAKSLNRPGLQRGLQKLRDGEAEGLLIVKLDRLTRCISDGQTLIDGFFGEKAGKSLCSVSDSIGEDKKLSGIVFLFGRPCGRTALSSCSCLILLIIAG